MVFIFNKLFYNIVFITYQMLSQKQHLLLNGDVYLCVRKSV